MSLLSLLQLLHPCASSERLGKGEPWALQSPVCRGTLVRRAACLSPAETVLFGERDKSTPSAPSFESSCIEVSLFFTAKGFCVQRQKNAQKKKTKKWGKKMIKPNCIQLLSVGTRGFHKCLKCAGAMQELQQSAWFGAGPPGQGCRGAVGQAPGWPIWPSRAVAFWQFH